MCRYGRLLSGILLFCMILSLCAVDTQAAGREPYTYTVKIYAGNHGSFAGKEHVNVDNSHSGSAYQIEEGKDAITIRNLARGDRVNFDAAMAGAVTLAGDSKYYVKGIRQSGRDNDTVGLSSFRVEGDKDYVVAYGIRGNLISYVVQYQDASGRTLADSRTYYGNVGDRPVVAFLYIEGYTPQAYNLTGTLSQNTADNVFTFVYERVRRGGSGGGTGGGTGDTGTGGGAGAAGTAPGTAAGAGAGAGTGGAAGTGVVVGGADGATAGGAAEGVVGAAAEGADAGGGGADAQAVPDEGVPADETPELVEAGDEQVPLDTLEDTSSSPTMLLSITTGLVAAAALVVLIVFWMKRRKGEKKAE